MNRSIISAISLAGSGTDWPVVRPRISAYAIKSRCTPAGSSMLILTGLSSISGPSLSLMMAFLLAVGGEHKVICRVRNYAEFWVHSGFSCGKSARAGRHSICRLEPTGAGLAYAAGISKEARSTSCRRAVGFLSGALCRIPRRLRDIRRFPIGKKTFLVSEFSRWLGSEQIAASEIKAEHEATFLRDRAQRRILKGGDAISLSGMTGWLRDRGVVDDEAALPTGPSGAEEILQEYAGWLREERGLAPSTIENYSGYIRRFLASLCGSDEPDLASISASQVTGLYPPQRAA